VMGPHGARHREQHEEATVAHEREESAKRHRRRS
jgi:hypothetical protein